MSSRPMKRLSTIVPWPGLFCDGTVINCCSNPRAESGADRRPHGVRGDGLHRLVGVDAGQHTPGSLLQSNPGFGGIRAARRPDLPHQLRRVPWHRRPGPGWAEPDWGE